MRLPEALRPWAAHLSLFPEDLALSLGAHMARLAAALGPLRARDEREGGEPQGYDGLTRRGSPERLLMSEWLMALEAPDEFVRRAAFGEQAYLRPAFRQPRGGRRTVALLDAGPDQLGAPRIAHLALLVVLARRAEAVGAGFSWAVLQSSPQRGPFSGVDAAAIGRWLKAGSAEPPTGARLAEWLEALEVGRAPEDVWLVGGARLARLPGAEPLSRVAVDEVIAPGARQLSVEVRPASRSARQVVLELPPAPQCVRLLRDPFEIATAAPVVDSHSSAVRALRFSADGLRLLLVYADGSVAAQALPRSPHPAPRPKRFQPVRDEALAAVGWRRDGGLITVTLRERTLRVYAGSLKGSRAGRVVDFPLPDGVESPRLPVRPDESPLLAMTQTYPSHEAVLLRDAAGTLYWLGRREEGGRTVSLIAHGVTALAERRGALSYVARRSPDPEAGDSLRLGYQSPKESWLRPLHVEGDGAAYFGQMTYSGDENDPLRGESGLLLVRHRPGRWQVWVFANPVRGSAFLLGEELSPRVGARVLGLSPLLDKSDLPGLVVLEQDERVFSRVTGSGATEPLVSAPARVVSASISHALRLLVWLTETGEVGAWSFQHRELVFRSTPGGSP